MPKFTSEDQQILAALEIHISAGDVVLATGAPFRRVIHLQRLWGAGQFQEQRCHEDQESLSQARLHTAQRYKPTGPCSMDYKLADRAYGPYWRHLESPVQQASPRRSLFERAVDAMFGGSIVESRRDGGRGAA